VELDSLMVITGQKDIDRASLVGDSPQQMAIERAGRTGRGTRPILNYCQPSSSSMILASAPELMKVAKAWELSRWRNLAWLLLDNGRRNVAGVVRWLIVNATLASSVENVWGCRANIADSLASAEVAVAIRASC